MVIFAAGTGLRPEEWIPLERRDVDLHERVGTVRRTYVDGRLNEFAGKTKASIRRVPLRRWVVDAVEGMPRRLDSRLLWSSPRGEYVNLRNFRRRDWAPALEAADVEYRGLYALRHSYASWSLAAGLSIFTLARRMGTSVEMIERTYGHLASDAEAYERDLLDTYDERTASRAVIGEEHAP
jgi:integrase